MARGLGGDDGPSVWQFLSVILVFAWVKKMFFDAKSTVEEKLEIGQNSAGPLQAETTKQIAALQDRVDRIPVAWSKLPHPKGYYEGIADEIWNELISVINIDEDRLIDLVKFLPVGELRAVAKCFGIKEPTVLGLTTKTLDIFKAYEWKLTGKPELATLRQIWKKSGLWL